MCVSFFFNDTATTAIYTYRHTLSLHDALPIFPSGPRFHVVGRLLELDTLARQRRRRQPRLIAVDRERVAGSLPREARMLPCDRGAQKGEGRPRQHVAAARSFGTEAAFGEQAVGPVTIHTKPRRPTSANIRSAPDTERGE